MSENIINIVGNSYTIIVEGVKFSSIKEASEAYDVNYGTVKNILAHIRKKGNYNQNDVDKVFTRNYKIKSKPIRVQGIDYKSIIEACRKNGLQDNEVNIRNRLKYLKEDTESAINKCFFTETRKCIKSITVFDIEYKSIKDAAEANGLSCTTARKRLKLLEGESIANEECINACFEKTTIKKDNSLIVEGKHYASLAEATMAYGLPYETIWQRLKVISNPNKDEIDQCFLKPIRINYRSGVFKVKEIEYDNLYEACKILGFNYAKACNKICTIQSKSEITQDKINNIFFPETKAVVTTDDIYILKSRITNLQPSPRESQIDVSKFKSESLGMLTLKASQGKIEAAVIFPFCDAIKELIKNDSMLAILQKEVGEIYRNEIVSLYTFYEGRIARKEYRHRGAISAKIRSSFKRVKGELFDGGNIFAASKLFKTSLFDDSHSPRPILSESYDLFYKGKDEELAQNISKVKFNSLDSLKKKIIRHLKARTKRYEDEWWGVINEYLKEKEYILTVKEGEYSKEVQGILAMDWLSIHPIRKLELVEDLKFEEILQLNLGLVDKYIIKELGINFLNENINAFSLASSRLLKKERSNFSLYSQTTDLGYYLCDKLIPSYVLYCIRCLLQSWYGFNAHTAQNLRFIDIDYRNSDTRKVIISPNKSKTGDDQIVEIKYISSSREIRLINLLINNHKELISWDTTLSDKSLLLYLAKNMIDDMFFFRPILSGRRNKKRLLSETNLPNYTGEQIRDQHIVTILAETGNVWEAMRVAGHKTLQTLINYADQRIIRIANDASINDFMKKLEATILWVVKGNTSKFEKMGLSIDDIDDVLLFPVTEYGYEEDIPEVDRWIKSLESSDSKIPLTEMRIEWCLRQYYYYALNWKGLSESNPERFKQVHLPRILLTIALRKVIQDKRPRYYKSTVTDLLDNIGRMIYEKK